MTVTQHIHRSLIPRVALAICLLNGACRLAVAQQQDDPSLESVQSVLAARCGECHNPRKRSGQLNLATPVGLARGGESGHVVAAGDLDDSLLWQRIDAEDMPPEAPLPESERALIRQWISAGAHGLPSADEVGRAGDGADHWAFQPPVMPVVPAVHDAARIENEVDHFIQARLEERGLALGAEAARATLIRRVSFDVTGLPPTPEEIAQFESDDQPGAYQRMVERYLASPRYGERWGRHWLDAAGYADSNGYFNADTDRPLAYRYRDYVIRSLNEDKPFDQFLTEQLAGDELAGYRPGADLTPDELDLYIATHFLRNSQDGTDSSDGNPDELLLDRFTVLEGMVEIIGQSLLGLTLQCARCHDHKFEPITQREYYQLQAILFPAYCPDQWVKAADRTLTVGTRAERDEHAASVARIDGEIAALGESLSAAAGPLRQRLLDERLAELNDEVRAALKSAQEKPEDERNEEDKAPLKEHQALLEVTDEQLDERFSHLGEFRGTVQARIASLENERPAPLDRVAVLTEISDEPPPHHVLLRGAYKAHGDEVPPGVPAVLCRTSDAYQVPPKSEGQYSSGRRLALARWLTDPNHPSLARVTVNRIWQHHFGQGLVATSENFGYTGSEPTHPELIDYLATRFVADAWSMKDLHRLILHSRTYRQTSAPCASALEIDPSNTLWWRYPLRRLDAESLRDAMLAASGLLDQSMFGPYVPTGRQADGSVVVADDQPGRYRRSLYLQQRRTQMASLLEVFDAPVMVTGCARRPTSTVALQSLELLNGALVMQCAEALAARLADEAPGDRPAMLKRTFVLTAGREPTDEEHTAIEAFIASQTARYAEVEHADALVWRDLCQMLLAANSFLYVE